MMPEDKLRHSFEAATQRVEPAAGGLDAIRQRIAQRRRGKRRIAMGLASIASAVVTTATAVVVATASCAPSPTPSPSVPPGGTSSAPTASPTSGPGITDGLPVYYLGTHGARTVLYREFRPLTLPEDTLTARISAAVTEMLRDDAADPDYRSLWPAGATVRGVRIEGSVAVVDLGGAATNSVGAEAAELTVQQLIWTVTAVAADAGSPLNGIRLQIDGSSPAELWGHVGIGGVLRRGDATAVQAPVWLVSPQQGDTVGRTFTVHIDGRVFEATAHLRVVRSDGTVVHDDFVMLSNGAPARGEAFVELTVPPGQYTVEAYYFSANDGSIQGMDDHDVTVS